MATGGDGATAEEEAAPDMEFDDAIGVAAILVAATGVDAGNGVAGVLAISGARIAVYVCVCVCVCVCMCVCVCLCARELVYV